VCENSLNLNHNARRNMTKTRLVAHAAYVVHHQPLVTSGTTILYSLDMAQEESLLSEAPVVDVSLSFVSI
jgi:hypothetical protein